MEVSAKTGFQVEESFKKNAELLIDKIEKGIIDTKAENPGIKLGTAKEKAPQKIDLNAEHGKSLEKKKK